MTYVSVTKITMLLSVSIQHKIENLKSQSDTLSFSNCEPINNYLVIYKEFELKICLMQDCN